jgi:hypothetical protein
MRLFAGLFVGTSFLLLGSCRSEPKPAFPDPLAEYQPEPQNPGFEQMRAAGEAAAEDGGALLDRLNWTPGYRRQAMQKAQRALSLLRRAQTQPIEYVYAPQSPLSDRVERSGWRFLGMVLLWNVEEAIERGESRQAVQHLLTLLRLAWDLMGGDALDVNLGYTIVRRIAERTWLSHASLDSEDLLALSDGIRRILENIPSVHQALRHEEAAMLSAVQLIQDAFLSGGLAEIRKGLPDSAAPAFDYLESLRSKSLDEQVEYFKKFAQEARDRISAWRQIASGDPSEWRTIERPTGERPWRRLAVHYFDAADRILPEYAYTLALSRLIATDAYLLAVLKSGKPLPKDLSALPKSIRLDPYSGQDLMFRVVGSGYELYSVGENRRDDRGSSVEFGDRLDIAAPLRS